MESQYPEEIPTVHPLRSMTERQLSGTSFQAGDAVVDHVAALGFKLTHQEADQVRLRVSDEVEKELRKIRRNQ